MVTRASQISISISCVAENGFKVRTVVIAPMSRHSSSHSANVKAFKHFTKMHPSSSSHCTEVPKKMTKTHLLFDSVNIVKNIGKNLLRLMQTS